MRHIPDQLETLRQASAGQGPLYALMDGALASELQAVLIEHQPRLDYLPLFLGDDKGSLAPVSPYLIRINNFDDNLLWWLLDEGQGKSWGVYLCSQAELTALHHHLFCLLSMRGLEGEKLYFRYYDPRVLRPFWKALNQEEQNRLMGPMQTILVEDEKEPGFWAYRRPKDMEPPPYPPAPNDWTTLPEPWWKLTQTQWDAISDGTQVMRLWKRVADQYPMLLDYAIYSCPTYSLTKPSEEIGQYLIKKAIRQAVQSGAKTDDGIFAYIGLMLHVAPQFMKMRELHHIHDMPAHTLDEYFPQLLSQLLDSNSIIVPKKIWMKQWRILGVLENANG